MSTFSKPENLALVGGISIVAVAAVAYSLVLQAQSRNGPKSYKSFTKCPPLEEHKTVDNTRDRFVKRKIPENIDAIVIGSGIGGMYCAALLAKAGKRVLVLEQHYVAGGCTHCFEDKGWEFDTGVHYVGRVEKYGYLIDLVTENESDKIKWARLGDERTGYCYDEIKIGEANIHPLRAGKEEFLEDLCAKFPEERAGLEEYIRLVVECNKKSEIHFFGKLFPRWIENLCERFVGSRFQELASCTVKEVLDRLFPTNTALKAVLAGQFGDYGMKTADASWFIHAGIVSHYIDGAYYPVGGPQVISKAMIPTICAAGGRVLVNAPVKKLLMSSQNVVTGVEMENGTAISCPLVISAAGAVATEVLTQNSSFSNTGTAKDLSIFKPQHECLKDGISHMYAFIGLDGESGPEGLDLRSSNLWCLPGENIDAHCEAFYADPFAEAEDGNLLMFMGFPSAKDPSFNERNPGKSTCVIITEAKAEWFDQFDKACTESQSGKRNNGDYNAFKDKFKDVLLKGLFKHYPQLEGKVSYCNIGSPLSNQYYLRRTASYGLSHEPVRYTAEGGLKPQQHHIPGLWLAGQDVATNGFAGALMGGLLTAHGVLGYGVFDLLCCGINLVDDLEKLVKAEKKAEKKEN